MYIDFIYEIETNNSLTFSVDLLITNMKLEYKDDLK